MNMQDKYDLMDRYLDGAADPSEAAELLDALRSDPSLVQEMEATVAVRDAIAADVRSINPPADLLSRIESDAAAAGFFAPTSTTVGGVGLSGSTILPWIITSVTFTALLTVSMLFMNTMRDDAAVAGADGQTVETTLQNQEQIGSGSFEASGGVVPPTPSAPEQSTSEGAEPSRTIAAPVMGRTDDASDRTERRTSKPVSTRSVAVAEKVSESSVERTDVDEPTTISSRPELLISEADEIQDDIERMNEVADNTEAPMLLGVQEAKRSRSTYFYSVGLRASLRPLTTFSYSTGSAPNSIGSVALELDAEIVPDHFFGIGYHRDLFPVFVVGTDGEATQESFMNWYSAHYRWSPTLDLPMGLRPFFHLGVGGTTRGFVTQPAMGMAMNISSVRIGAGIDALGLAFQDKGTWSMAWSPALRIELGYTF